MLNTTDNSSALDSSYYTLLITQMVIGLVSVVANVLLLVTLKHLRSRHLKKSMRSFFTLEAVSHLFLGITFIFQPHITAKLGCGVVGLTLSILCGVMITGIFLLSLDTYLPIMKPCTHDRILTPQVARLLVVLVVSFWVAVCSVSYAIKKPKIYRKDEPCSINDSQQQPMMVLTMSTLCLLLMVTSAVVQGRTVCLLRATLAKRHIPDATDPRVATISHLVSQSREQQGAGTQCQTHQYRLVKILMISLCMTFMCIVPPNVVILATALCDILGNPAEGMNSARPQLAALDLVECALYPCIVLTRSMELRASLRVC